jgi:hypothetical protein
MSFWGWDSEDFDRIRYYPKNRLLLDASGQRLIQRLFSPTGVPVETSYRIDPDDH